MKDGGLSQLQSIKTKKISQRRSGVTGRQVTGFGAKHCGGKEESRVVGGRWE